MAKWSTAYKDSLPDSAFLIVLPGGTKKDGCTVPKHLRKFPVYDANGKLDSIHVHSALTKISTADIPPKYKKIAQSKAEKLLNRLHESEEMNKSSFITYSGRLLVKKNNDEVEFEKEPQDPDKNENNIRYHVTPAASKILKEGFKPNKDGGVGGEGDRTAEVYTSEDPAYSFRLRDHFNALEDIRTSEDPLVSALAYVGQKGFDSAQGDIGVYENMQERKLSSAEKAMVIAVRKNGEFPELEPESFFIDEPKRTFKIIGVDVSQGHKRGESTNFGHEESWLMSTVKPFKLQKNHYMSPTEAADDFYDSITNHDDTIQEWFEDHRKHMDFDSGEMPTFVERVKELAHDRWRKLLRPMAEWINQEFDGKDPYKLQKSEDEPEYYPSDRYAYKTNVKDVIYIPINRLETPYQTDKATDPEKVKSNVEKMRRSEALAPIVIGYGSDDGARADLHDGHHRLEASKKMGYTHVPCVVGGRNERRVKAAEKRYRKVWKSMSDDSNLVKSDDTLPIGTEVSWHYRSAIGHGTIAGIAKKGETHATTKYRIREHDHHPGEPAIVEHYGSALQRSTKKSMGMFAVKNGRLLIKKPDSDKHKKVKFSGKSGLSHELKAKVKSGNAHWITVTKGPLEGRHLLIDGSRPANGQKSQGKILAGHGIPSEIVEKITGATHAHHLEHEQSNGPKEKYYLKLKNNPKSKSWVAKISSGSGKYKFDRAFMKEVYNRDEHQHYKLEDGVYELSDAGERKFVQVKNGDMNEIDEAKLKQVLSEQDNARQQSKNMAVSQFGYVDNKAKYGDLVFALDTDVKVYESHKGSKMPMDVYRSGSEKGTGRKINLYRISLLSASTVTLERDSHTASFDFENEKQHWLSE